MKPITTLIPCARRWKCGDRDFLVLPLTLRKLSLLQEWLDGAVDLDPLATISEELARSDDGAARHALLVRAHDAAETGPPVFGDRASAERFGTPEGIALFIYVTLGGRETPEDCARMALTISEGEYGALMRIALAKDVLREIEAMLGATDTQTGSPITWNIAIDELSRERNWTYDYIYGMTLAEFANARRHGKPPAPMEVAALPGESLAETVARARRAYAGQE